MTALEIVFQYIRTRTSAGDNVFPQGTQPQPLPVPCVTMLRVSAPRTSSHSGSSHFSEPSVQLTAWDDDYDGAQALGAELIAELEGVTITAGDDILKRGSVIVDRDDNDPTTELFSRIIEFQFDWEEA